MHIFFTICSLFEYQQICIVKCLWVIQYPIQTAYSVKNCGEFEGYCWCIFASHTNSESELSNLRLNSLSECVCVSQPFIHSPGSSFIWTPLWQFSLRQKVISNLRWSGWGNTTRTSAITWSSTTRQKMGFYYIKSSYKAQKPVVNTLKNHLLKQNLQRLVFLSYCKPLISNYIHGRYSL